MAASQGGVWGSHPGYEAPISGGSRVESNEQVGTQTGAPADTTAINFTPIKPTSCLVELYSTSEILLSLYCKLHSCALNIAHAFTN